MKATLYGLTKNKNDIHVKSQLEKMLAQVSADGVAVIDGANIAAESIYGKSIVADSFEATQIKAGTITSDHITTGGIVADKIKTGVLRSSNDASWLNLNDGTFSYANGNFTFQNGKMVVRAHTIQLGGQEVPTKTQTEEYADSLGKELQGQIDTSIKSTEVEYYSSTSNTSPVGGVWSTTAPEWKEGRFMWSRTKITPNKGSVIYNPNENGTNISGADGVSPIVGFLTNESITLPSSDKGVVPSSSFTSATGTFEVYDGTTRKTSSGVAYSVSGTPSGITVSINATTGVYKVSAMTTGANVLSGTATLRAVYGGVTIDKILTVTKALAGSQGPIGGTGGTGPSGKDATTYWINASTNAIKKDVTGTIVPSTITFSSFSKTGTANPVAYAGRFIIQTSTDGVSYEDAYTSTANQASYTYTIPATASFVKARYYLAGGTTILLDEQTIPVLVDAEGIEIGGRNLLKGTSSEWKTSDVSATAHNVHVDYGINISDLGLNAGDTITVGIDIDASESIYDYALRAEQRKDNANRSSVYSEKVLAGETGRVYITTKIMADRPFLDILLQMYPTTPPRPSEDTVKYRMLMIEKGNKATDWTPAPEDVEARIDNKADIEAVNNLKNETIPALKDGLLNSSEKEAVRQSLNVVSADKKGIDMQYTTVYANTALTGTAKSNLKSAKDALNTAFTNLQSAINAVLGVGDDTRIRPNQMTLVTARLNEYGTALSTYNQRYEQAQDAISTEKKRLGDVQAKKYVDDLEVGGRNLIRNSGFVDGRDYWGSRGNHNTLLDTIRVYNGNNSLNVMSSGAGSGVGSVSTTLSTTFEEGTKIVVSFFARAIEGNTTLHVELHGGRGAKDFQLTLGWKKFELEVEYATSSRLFFWLRGAGAAAVNSPSAQQGTKATDWTPAPEDIELAYKAVAMAERELAEINAKAYADGVIEIEEKRAIADAQAKLKEAKKYVDDVEIGGRNHLRNTGVDNSEPISMFGVELAAAGSAGGSSSLNAGAEYYTLESTSSSGEAYYRAMVQGTLPSELSGTWAFSGEVLIPEGTSGVPYTRTQIAITAPAHWVNSYGNGERPINATKGIWTKFIHTFEIPEGTQSLHLGIKFADKTQEVGDKIHFKNFKLEKGNKATDWTPAPEDVELAQNKKVYNPVRYIRDWLKGSSADTSNRWYEIMANDTNGTNVAQGKTVTTNGTASNLSVITNGLVGGTYSSTGTGKQYVEVDLGSVYYNIASVSIWHYHIDNRTYNETRTEVSEDRINWYPVFDSLTEGTYAETESGKTHPNTRARSEALISAYNMSQQLATSTSEVVINGGNITAGTVKSANSDSWINLDNGQFSFGKGNMIWNGSNLTVKGNIDASSISTGTLAVDRIPNLNANKITSGSINAARIAADTITGTHIAARTITTDRIIANAITANEIAAGTITATEIKSRAITTDRIATNAITANEISVENLSALSANLGNVTAGTITSTNGLIDINLNTGVVNLGQPLTINLKPVAIKEDVEEQIGEKADKETVNDISTGIESLQAQILEYATKNEVSLDMAEYQAKLVEIQQSAESGLEKAEDVEAAVNSVTRQMGVLAESWVFTNNYIKFAETNDLANISSDAKTKYPDIAVGAMLISNNNGSSKMLLTNNSLFFISNNEVVTAITDSYMNVDRAIFVSSAQIGSHKWSPSTTNEGHFLLEYVKP